ncbi:ABC transporter permease [Antarctobacter sp.]|uniref:ABC transporter permease n=1 Tax=Antarctobacter sp. TaxID=1872577 RepID=UPI003A8D1FB1
MHILSSLLRSPAAASVLSLIGVLIFYVVIGGVNLGTLFGAASWVNFAANLGIVAIPVGLLMISGELDISIGAMIPAGAMTTAIVSGYYDLPIIFGMLAALSLGVVVGTINGILTIRTTVPSLIITLGTLVAMQGVVLSTSKFLTGQASVAITAPDWAKSLFGQLIGGSHQVIIVWWVVIAVIFWFVVHQSRYGNWVFAMGGDRESARNLGIPVDRMTIGLFILTATSASFVGMCQAILFNSAQVSGGMNIIFNVIVSVVVGGVLLTGGFGSVIGIFFGTLTFAIVSQGIYFTDIDRNWSSLIIGAMLLIAVGLNESFRKLVLTGRLQRNKGSKANV